METLKCKNGQEHKFEDKVHPHTGKVFQWCPTCGQLDLDSYKNSKVHTLKT